MIDEVDLSKAQLNELLERAAPYAKRDWYLRNAIQDILGHVATATIATYVWSCPICQARNVYPPFLQSSDKKQCGDCHGWFEIEVVQ